MRSGRYGGAGEQGTGVSPYSWLVPHSKKHSVIAPAPSASTVPLTVLFAVGSSVVTFGTCDTGISKT